MSSSKNGVWLWVAGGVAAVCLVIGLGLAAVIAGVALLLLRSDPANVDVQRTADSPATAERIEDVVEVPPPAPRSLPESLASPIEPPPAEAPAESPPELPVDKPFEPPPPDVGPAESAPTDTATAATIDRIAGTAPFATSAPLPTLLPGVSLKASAMLRSTLTAPAPARALAFSPDGGLLAVAAGSQVVLWNAATGSPAGTLTGHKSHVTKICFSRDGARLATASHDHSAGVWDAKALRGLAKLDGHEMPVHVVAFSPTTDALASGGFDGRINIWNVAAGKPERTLAHGETQVTSLACSPDGERLASGGRDGSLVVWDAASGEKLATHTAHASAVNQLVFLPGGKFLVTAGADQLARFWSTRAPFEAAAELDGHRGGVSSVTVHPTGRLLATAGGSDGRIVLWDAALGDELASFRAHESGVRAIEFSPDGAILVSCAEDRAVKLWNVALAGWELPGVPLAFDVEDRLPDPRTLPPTSDDDTDDAPSLLESEVDDPLVGAHAAARGMRRLFRSGVGVWHFARQAAQGPFGDSCFNDELGKPVGGPEIVRGLEPLSFDPKANAVAKCYVKIAESGAHDFLVDSFFRRSRIYINGHAQYSDSGADFSSITSPLGGPGLGADRGSGVVRVELAEGHAALVLVGYWGSHGHVGLLWRTPGEETFQPIPTRNLYWLPNK